MGYSDPAKQAAYNKAWRTKNIAQNRLRERENQRKLRDSDPAKYNAARRKYNADYAKRHPDKLKATRAAAGFRARSKPGAKSKARDYYRKWVGLPPPTRPCPAICECCGRPSPLTLHLDHCHNTGKFRGWLCIKCNVAAGLLDDNPKLIVKLLNYLKGN